MTVNEPITADEPVSQNGTRSADTVTAILDATRSLLAAGGLAALSMRLVAERVGLSATAIYRHFHGKEDLVSRVVHMGYRRFGEYLSDAMEQYPAGSIERILALGDAYVRFAFENQEYFRVLFSIQKRIPSKVDELPEGGGYDLLKNCVVAAIDAGSMIKADPDVVTHYLWASVHGFVTLSMACSVESCGCEGAKEARSAPEMFRAFAPLLTDGLGTAPRKPVSDEAFSAWKAAQSK